MKLKNILFSLIMLVSMLFIGTANAETTAPSSYVIDGSKLHTIYGSSYLSGSQYIDIQFKKTTDGKIIYCIERSKAPIGSGTTEKYTLQKELSSKVAYVMENGYPNKSIFGNADKDYYTTGLAIWYVINPNDSTFEYFNLANGTYRGNSSDIVVEMAKLVNGANSYSYTSPSIKINNSNSNLSLSSDGKYYVSSSMGVKTAGTVGNYTVSLSNAPEGTIVTDTKGNAKTTFATNESFLVKVPVSNVKKISNEFKVNVSAKGTINKAYAYTSTRSNVQNTGALYPENSNVNDSTTVKLNVVTVVEISKVDVTTGEELAGAHLELKDEKGNLIEAWVSTNESHVIEGLEPGKYTLTEVIAPDGYELSKETVTFVVKEDGTVDGKVIMYNTPETIEVPSTGTFKTITTSLIGLLIIGLGSVIVYRNYKKNEEN
jgi:LPXTG-motif cell wall-anchored protein